MFKVTNCYTLSLAMQFPWQHRDNFSFRKLRGSPQNAFFSQHSQLLHLPATLKLTILRHLEALKGNPWAWKHAVCMCVPESAYNQLNHFHGELEAAAEACRLFYFIYCSKPLTPTDNRSDAIKWENREIKLSICSLQKSYTSSFTVCAVNSGTKRNSDTKRDSLLTSVFWFKKCLKKQKQNKSWAYP